MKQHDLGRPKYFIFSFLTLVIFFGFLTLAGADLIDRGGGLIYCDTLDITWLQNANYTGQFTMTWDDAMSWTDAFTYYDSVRDVTWDDWRLPSAYNQDGSGPDLGYNVTGSEMGHLYYTELRNGAFSGGFTNSGPFYGVQPAEYWSGTETVYGTNPDDWAVGFYFTVGCMDVRYKDRSHPFWPVRDGDVPIPSTCLLLFFGLAGMAFIKKKIG